MPSASNILEGLDLSSLLEDYYYAEARALALDRLESAASKGQIDLEGPPINDEIDIVLSYLISRLILSATENQALVNYVALSEAIRAENYLNSETDEEFVKCINQLGVIEINQVDSVFKQR